MSLRDAMEALRPGDPSSGLDATLAIRFVQADDASSTFETDAGVAHHNPVGVVHGGMMTSLADAAMGHLACRLFAAPCTNIDLQVRFLRAATGGRLTGTARVVRRGRRVTVLTADVTDPEGRVLATATSAFVPL